MRGTWLTTDCPTCKGRSLDVQIGRKTSTKEARCGLCRAAFTYSAWVISKTPERTVHQIDLFPVGS